MADETVWKRLTRLFKSGPVVRHKLASSLASYEPQGTARAYKKELSSLYVNSLASYGQYERLSRYADYCFHPDTLIYTTEGHFTIKELSEKYESGRRFNVYAYDFARKKVVIADAHSPRLKRDGQECDMVEITFDDGGKIRVTDDHPIVMRNATKRPAKELVSGDSIMPFYKKDLMGQGYQWIYTMDRSQTNNGWELEHRLVAENALGRGLLDDEVVHHKDFQRANNIPSNLQVMNCAEHTAYHTKINNRNKKGKKNQKHSDWMRKFGSHRRDDVNFASIVRAATTTDYRLKDVCELLRTDVPAVKLRLRERGFKNWLHFRNMRVDIERGVTFEVIKRESSVDFKDIVDNHVGCDTIYELSCKLSCTEKSIVRRICAHGYTGWEDFKRKTDVNFVSQRGHYEFDNALNHKVVSVERVERSEVYNITVEEFHNLAAGSIVKDDAGNSKLSCCFYFQSEMEFTAEIASALDIYADEVTSVNEKGQMLVIESKNQHIKKILDTLFFDILNIEFNLHSWVRSLCKHGDFVLFVDASEQNGILNLLPIPINEIEREEGYDPADPFAVRFRWLAQGNTKLENWQVIHFRLLGNDNFLPYGSSVIEPARRVWRQLILIEDAMLVYRIVRSPERRIFKIEVGNVKPEDVPTEMDKIISRLKRTQVIDQTSGRVDLRYNPLSVDEDYYLPMRNGQGSDITSLPGGQFPVRRNSPIPLLDGRVITIEELAREYDEGKENWVYSVKDKTSEVVPGKVIWCGKNYTCNRIHRVWLDDGSYIDMAPEHPVVMRNGSHKRTDELTPGDSLMPFSARMSSKTTRRERVDGYTLVRNPSSDEFEFVHRLVANDVGGREEALERTNEKSTAIHHVDFKKTNNYPDNLRWMGFWEHRQYHREIANFGSPEVMAKCRAYTTSEKHREFITKRISDPNDGLHKWIYGENIDRLIEHNKSEDTRKNTSLRNSKRWEDAEFRQNHSGDNHWNVRKWSSRYAEHTPEELRTFCVENNISSFKDLLSHPKRFYKTDEQFRKFLRFHGISTWTDFANDYLNIKRQNHSVVRVEVLDETDDVYCMTVVGPRFENDRHNFATLGLGVEREFDVLDGIFVRNTGDIEDVQYIQNKLFAAIKIPKSYLNFEGDVGSKATLAQEDVRFSRTIQRIQKIVLSELTKIAVIHLYLMGYRGEDLVDYDIKMANPSTIAEQQKLELWRMKFEIAGTAQEGVLDRTTVYKDVFGFNDKKIEEITDGKRADKLEDLALEAITIEDEAETSSGAGELPPELPGGDEETPPEETGATGAPGNVGAEGLPEEGLDLGDEMFMAEAEEEDIDERRNPGSEGDDASIAVDKGHDLFDPGTDLNTHVFGTEKQTASDPFDMRARNRLITRPFSEDVGPPGDEAVFTGWVSEATKRFQHVEDEMKDINNIILEIKTERRKRT